MEVNNNDTISGSEQPAGPSLASPRGHAAAPGGEDREAAEGLRQETGERSQLQPSANLSLGELKLNYHIRLDQTVNFIYLKFSRDLSSLSYPP